MSSTQHGLLVLADISGFTAFTTATELEHAPPIIAALLEAVIERLAPPLTVESIAGDAVFATAVDGTVTPPAKLLALLEQGFAAFRDKQRELVADDSCGCKACRTAGDLRLKAVGHYGPFVTHTIGGHAQSAGPDVILAHRLLKNGVPRDADYALFTESALRYMGVDPTGYGFRPHVERYDHFGEVACFVGAITASVA
jgi:class 3 adenylate cyclase